MKRVHIGRMPKRGIQQIGMSRVEAEATRLNAIWQREKKARGFTQAQAAKAMGLAAQGAVSQLLRGHEPLSLKNLLEFCLFLRCSPLDIRPDFRYSQLLPGHLSPEAAEIAANWALLPPKMRESIRDLVQTSLGNHTPRSV